jgi:hypothetical protein
MNGDGMVNVVDIQLVTSAVLGCGYATNGEQAKVKYEIQVGQNEVPVPATLSTGSATLPSLQSIKGRVSPVCFFGTQTLTLKLKDGQRFG